MPVTTSGRPSVAMATAMLGGDGGAAESRGRARGGARGRPHLRRPHEIEVALRRSLPREEGGLIATAADQVRSQVRVAARAADLVEPAFRPVGGASRAADPQISGKLARSVETTGQPRAIASSAGSRIPP